MAGSKIGFITASKSAYKGSLTFALIVELSNVCSICHDLYLACMRALMLCDFARLSVSLVAVMAFVFHFSPLVATAAIRHLGRKNFVQEKKKKCLKLESVAPKSNTGRTEHSCL